MLLLVAVGTFLLLEVAPGDAGDAYLARAPAAPTPPAWRSCAPHVGLDAGPLQRFLAYAAALAACNLGWSVAFERPVLDVLLERLPNTLVLMGLATALAFVLGSALGIVAGAHLGSIEDRALSLASVAVYAVPDSGWGSCSSSSSRSTCCWLPIGGWRRSHRETPGLTGSSISDGIWCCRWPRSAWSISRSISG